MASRTLTYSIYHNNIHGNDLLDSSVENLHLVCYTESLVVVLFFLPHKRGLDKVVARIFVWYKTYSMLTISHIILLPLMCVCIYIYKYRRPDNQEEDFAAARQSV